MSIEQSIIYTNNISNKNIMTNTILEDNSKNIILNEPSNKNKIKYSICCNCNYIYNESENPEMCCYYNYNYKCFICKKCDKCEKCKIFNSCYSEGCNCSTCKNYKNPEQLTPNNSFIYYLFPCCK